MRLAFRLVVGLLLGVSCLAVALPAGETKFAAAVADEKPTASTGAEVTIKGVLMLEKQSCALDPDQCKEDGQVLFAVEGTPGIDAEINSLMKDYYTGDSIDGDQARKILERFTERLKYWLVPGNVVDKKDGKDLNPNVALTGVIYETDGKKWITVSKIEKKGVKLKYPEKMLAPDKPLAQPGKEPLMLKINDSLSLKCILLPAGKFMMGNPFYGADPRYPDYPHMVTLTKPFYLAECPVTQEMWDAVMGAETDRSTLKDPKRPVRNIPWEDANKFCQIVSEKNGGRKVRLPTQAEWEYAARVGTSNPPFRSKYTDQICSGPGRNEHLPVKSKQPNAWGVYDMVSSVYEMTCESDGSIRRHDEVDPNHTSNKVKYHLGKGNIGWCVASNEAVDAGGPGRDDNHYGSWKFRLLVEATPEKITEMTKVAK